MILIMSYMSNSSEVQTIKSLASANHQVPRLLPWWHFTSLKQCNIILPLNPNPLPIIGPTSLELKPYSPYMKRTSTKPSLAQVSKGAPHMLNHTTPFCPLHSKKSRSTYLVVPNLVALSPIHKNRISKSPQVIFFSSLIEPQLLPCMPVCGYKLFVLIVFLLPTLTVFLIRGIFGIHSNIYSGGIFVEMVRVFRPLAIFPEELHCGYLTGFGWLTSLQHRHSPEYLMTFLGIYYSPIPCVFRIPFLVPVFLFLHLAKKKQTILQTKFVTIVI